MIPVKAFGAYATFISIIFLAYFLGWLEIQIVKSAFYSLGFAWGFIGYFLMHKFGEKVLADKDIKQFEKKLFIRHYNKRIKHWQKKLQEIKEGKD